MNRVVTCNAAHRFCDRTSSARVKKYAGEEVFEIFATFHTHVVQAGKKAGAIRLKNAFEEHLRQTERHVERLEEAFEHLGMPARGKRCEGMKHLIAEGDEMIGEAEDEAARDAIIIAAAQKVDHYEIASYGTTRPRRVRSPAASDGCRAGCGFRPIASSSLVISGWRWSLVSRPTTND